MLLLLVAVHACAANFFALLQDASGVASFAVFDESGNQLYSASQHFPFRFPLAEATFNVKEQHVYLITYPTDTNVASLYIMDSKMQLVALKQSKDVGYFDLQYSNSQDTFYGIFVSSTYGRMLSEFDLSQSDVVHRSIQSLPYMWYVNASTFDQDSNRYFGLLNNFPNKANSTAAQKLAVGDFDQKPGSVAFLDLAMTAQPSSVIHFIAWSSVSSELYGLAQRDSKSISFVKIDPSTGKYTVLLTVGPFIAGPIFAGEWDSTLFAFLQDASTGMRVLARFDFASNEFYVVKRYSDKNVVAAITRMDLSA